MKTKYNLTDNVWNVRRRFVNDINDKSASIMKKTKQIAFYEILGPLKIYKIELEEDKITYHTTGGVYKEEELLESFEKVTEIINVPAKEVVNNLLDSLYSVKGSTPELTGSNIDFKG